MKKLTGKCIAVLVAGFLMCSGAGVLPNQMSTSLTAYAYDTQDGTVVPVIGIADKAFDYQTTITNLVLGANVYRIGKGAFLGCTNLTTATFNEGLEEIGQQAFDGCGFEEITLPATLKEINWGFPDNKNLRTVNLLGGNEMIITGSSFESCEALETVTMRNGIIELSSYCFSECSNLKNVQLSPTLKTINSYAFNYCSSLETIKIPDSIEFIDYMAFRGAGLTEVEISGNGEIGENVFSHCNNLTKVTLHEGPKKIGSYAFEYCSSLKEITIPATVEQIGRNSNYGNTFYDAKNLESITFLGMNTVIFNAGIPKTTVIRGYECSTAQAYAEKNGYTFEVISSNPTEPEVPTDTTGIQELMPGDVNNDNSIDILDVIAMNKAVLGKEIFTEEQIKISDFNQSGAVDANDSLQLMKYIVGLIDNLME